MKGLVTDQGTGVSNGALCNICIKEKANIAYAREMASRADDIDPVADFVDCSLNTEVHCCICGRYSESENN